MSAAIAVAALALVYFQPAAPPSPRLPPELQEEPDLYMEGATITQFLPDGAIKYRLEADEIKHFETHRITRLREPGLVMHDENQPPWEIVAREGVITVVENESGATEERVDLRREVVLTQRKPDGRFVELNTSQMYVYPDRKFAESDQAVTIATHTGRSDAVGFEGDLEKNWMRLHSSQDQRVQIIVYANSSGAGIR